jgi:hypothetical protein
MASAFSPKRSKRFYMQMSEENHKRLLKCSLIEKRSMSEIAHLGVEIILERLEKQQKKEGK